MKRKPAKKHTGPVCAGIDVSKYQSRVDWGKVASSYVPTPFGLSKIEFAFARTGDGKSTDERFVENWDAIGKTELVRGSYRYFRADRDGKTQAELDVSLLKDFRPGIDLPPVVDLEDGARKDLPGGVFTSETGAAMPLEMVADELKEYLETIESQLGVTPIIYTGQSFHWWFSQGKPDLAAQFAAYPLWLPSYTKEPLMPVGSAGDYFPWENWTMWQFTSEGKVGGIQGNVDVNVFRGTREDLTLFAKSLHFNDPIDHLLKIAPMTQEEIGAKLEDLRKAADLLEEKSSLLCNEIVDFCDSLDNVIGDYEDLFPAK